MNLKAFGLIALSFFGIAQSSVTYQIDFQVSALSANWNFGNWVPDNYENILFSYRPNIGDIFIGTVTIEDNVLATDGNQVGGLLDLDITMAGLNWSYNAITGNSGALAGFRDPGLGGISPVFIVNGGELVGLYGGVYGQGDAPFVDFNPGNQFQANDLSGSAMIFGNMYVSRVEAVPEPSSFIILVLGIGLLVFSLRRSKTSM